MILQHTDPTSFVWGASRNGAATTPRYHLPSDGAEVGELANNGNMDLTRTNYSDTFVTRNSNFNQNMTSQPFRSIRFPRGR